MKILAIRGRNLASLAGDFDIDFRSEPLQSAGLFAISGPTGAGKSTLLDALCVALYDATPRLLHAGRSIALPDVKDEMVTPQDTRNLLRRGAAEGHAEVEFLGNDGIVYRTRWSVRRARSRADGKLQAASMNLWRLPQVQALGGTNAEVKSEIVRRIGLNFEQFTRAVLLAQNEFSAFLKAGDNERGELLETLTGSLIYTEISRLAFERARAEASALQRLAERLQGMLPLPQEDRQLLECELQEARTQLQHADARLAQLAQQVQWQREAGALAAAAQEARAACSRQHDLQQQAAGRRAGLAEVEAVQPARALFDESRRLAAEAERLRTAIIDCEAKLQRSSDARQAAERGLLVASDALHAAETEHAAKRIELDQAKALDARIDAMQPAHAESRRNAQDAAAAAAAVRASLQRKAGERDMIAAQLRQLQDWLRAHAGHGPLAAAWQRCDILLAQAREHAQHALQAAQQATLARAQQQQGEHAERAHVDAYAAAGAALQRRRAERDAAAEKLRLLDAARIPGERAQLAALQQQLIDAERLCRALHDTQLRRFEALADNLRHAQALAAAQRGWQDAAAQQPAIAAAQAQAERSLRRAEAASGATAEQLRAALAPGEPCPVCGACAHPYHDADPRLSAMLQELQREVAACREASRRNIEAQATQKALADAALAAQQEAERRTAELDSALAQTDQAWRRHPLFASEAALSAPPHACAAWLTQRQQASAERMRELDAAEHAHDAAAAQRDGAQQSMDAAAAHADACRAALDAARHASAEAARALVAARERERDAVARRDASLDALDALPLPREWRSAWQAAPEAFHEDCRASVAAWDAQSLLQDAAAAQAGALEAEIAALQARCLDAEAERERAAAAHAARDAGLLALQGDRAALFAGRPAAAAEAEIAAQLGACRAAREAAAALLQQCALEVTRCAESRDGASVRLAETLAATQACAARCGAWLAQHNAGRAEVLDQAGLSELLAHDADWIRAERLALSALDAALGAADAVLRERERRAEAHLAARAASWSELPEAELEPALAALSRLRQTQQDQASALALALSADDARRAEAADMQRQLEQQQAAQRRWAQLSDLIGSADGKKFRNYAQQTTLDVLLAYANRHLADLSRRYRLERVRDTLALMVVDQDMAEEMRSVHSLSGGESFLVSLALALGLASLSSNQVRVESLFIDEGFGSLDAETLRVAMDALDGLQALGRKVGVISHVQEMTERIATRILVRRTAGGSSKVSVSQGS